MEIYLCDLDGTVADCSHRLHLIKNGNNKWDEFFSECKNDTPISSVIKTVRLLKKAGAMILMLTGRSASCRAETVKWLQDFQVPYDGLYMRTAGDHRQDNIVKDELLQQVATEWNWDDIIGAFEDRKQVVDMLRAKGLKVFHVAEGNF